MNPFPSSLATQKMNQLSANTTGNIVLFSLAQVAAHTTNSWIGPQPNRDRRELKSVASPVRRRSSFLRGRWSAEMGGKDLIVFDFDRTLIEDDSDRWVITNMGLTQLFNQLRPTLPWCSLMDRMLQELHIQGKTIDDIAHCLKRVPMHSHVIAAIKSAHALGCDLKVVSDSNSFYIKNILEHHGIYSCFTEIITNPVAVDNGRLRIFPYHHPYSSHGCRLCPQNLCKGHVIDQIRTSISEAECKSFIYIGDGLNDFCPTLKLAQGDSVMPRKKFPLSNCILENSQLVKAKVFEWEDGEDLAKILLNLINLQAS